MQTLSRVGVAIGLFASLFYSLHAASREFTPTVTLAEGANAIVSGGRGYLPAAGVRLRQCDIVHTGPQALVQLEIEGGGMVQLGPETRFLADLPFAHSGEPIIGPDFLLSGWAKLTVAKRDKKLPHRINTPYFDLLLESGVAVVRVGADGGQVFVERGEGLALEPSGRSLSRVAVGAGQTYSRKSRQQKGEVADRVDPAMVSSMPRAFRDSLPPLLGQLQASTADPKPAPDFSYQGVEDWLKGEPEVRQCLYSVIIRSAQETLRRKGLDVGPIDGILGPRTQAALREFQQQQGLNRSGEIDQETLKALNLAEPR